MEDAGAIKILEKTGSKLISQSVFANRDGHYHVRPPLSCWHGALVPLIRIAKNLRMVLYFLESCQEGDLPNFGEGRLSQPKGDSSKLVNTFALSLRWMSIDEHNSMCTFYPIVDSRIWSGSCAGYKG
jgi:hypothetical protein